MLTVLDITAPLPHIELQLEKKWNSRLTDHSKVFLLLFLLARSLFFVDAFCLIQVVKNRLTLFRFTIRRKKKNFRNETEKNHIWPWHCIRLMERPLHHRLLRCRWNTRVHVSGQILKCARRRNFFLMKNFFFSFKSLIFQWNGNIACCWHREHISKADEINSILTLIAEQCASSRREKEFLINLLNVEWISSRLDFFSCLSSNWSLSPAGEKESRVTAMTSRLCGWSVMRLIAPLTLATRNETKRL